MGRRHAARLAFVKGTLLLVAELFSANQSRVRVALTEASVGIRSATSDAIVVRPAAPFEHHAQQDAGKARARTVGRVGRDLPAAVPLADLLLAQTLLAFVENNERSVDESDAFLAGIGLKPGRRRP